jgi:hypothetical protein
VGFGDIPMQKMPFSRLYSYLEKPRHSHVLDESLQLFDCDNVEQPIVKPLYNKELDINKISKKQPVLSSK